MAGGFSEQGEGKALGSLQGLPMRFRIGVAAAADMVGKVLVTTNRSGMEASGSGRMYPNQPRQSSAPGNYPAVQSGQLLGSVDYAVQGMWLEFGSKGAFNNGFDYAIAQNQGTSKMAARPFLELTVNKTKAKIESILGEVVWRKTIGG